jgi:site-specific DNA recombinase
VNGPAALYARVSTDEQAENGTSLDVQLAECEGHARHLGAGATTAYVDAGISGTLLERPSLGRLRADVAAGRVSLVVCYDPDRLSRNLGHLLLLVDEFRRYGAEVEFTNFAMTASADGRLLFAMRGAIAEFETHKIRQRMTAGKMARAREGRPVGGGHTIYGYAYDKANRRFLADPAEAPVVAHIFRLAEEHGTYAIAARLNAAAVPAKHGGAWSQTTVYGILRNRTYLGRMQQMGGVGYVEVPPLVTLEAFERVEAIVAARRNRPRGPARHPYLLTGHLRCGVCGRRMGGGYGRTRTDGYHTRYACSGKRSMPPCPSAYYPSEAVDDALWRHLVADLLAAEPPADLARRVLATLPVAAPEPARAAGSGLERQRDRLLAAYRNGLIDTDALAEQLHALAATERLGPAQPAPAADAKTAATTVTAVLERARSAASLDDRRFVIEALGVTVVLGPGPQGRITFAPTPG